MQLKVGDTVLCKKESKYLSTVTFEVGEYYYVCDIDDDMGCFIIEYKSNYKPIWFSLNKEKYNGEHYIWDYFYSTKELRKLKLNKIKKI